MKLIRARTHLIKFALSLPASYLLVQIFYCFLVHEHTQQRKLMFYNKTYPLTKPISTGTGATFRIGLITDMDTESKCKRSS